MRGLWKMLALAAIVAAPQLGHAADLKFTKAQPPAVFAPVQLDIVKGWTGFYGGVNITASGTGLNVANLGELTQNGNALGPEIGWETYNGKFLYGARAGVDYDVSGSGAAALSDHLAWHAGVRIGGNMASMFGITAPPTGFVSMFSMGVLYAAVEGCGKHGQNGECTSAGYEMPIANSPVTINAEVRNWQLRGSSDVPGQTIKTDNSIVVGGMVHF